MTSDDPSNPLRSPVSRRRFVQSALLVGTAVAGAETASASTTNADASASVRRVDVDHDWTTVTHSTEFVAPVAVAGPLSYGEADPGSLRLRNVTGTSLEVAVEEWLSEDGTHAAEKAGLLAAESGTAETTDGTLLEAGTVRTDHTRTRVSFAQSFSSAPVVLTQVQTLNGWQPVVTRNEDVSADGATLRLQEEEALGTHLVETVGYVAVEPGTGTLDGTPFEVGVADVGDAWKTVSFADQYQSPVLLADLQTTNGSDTCDVRYRNLTESSVDLRAEEETSRDAETVHRVERVGYVVFDAGDVSADGYGAGGYGAGDYGV